ncbi:bifunctional diaminohydroxyphosphoribosylaminopyrimidine deaminase/5-amino-6-(5-phosphoribosylamino)uracil reductase RibD [bacterium]|nr:bifunctional diaminohydroxyphosphoribosylaminopyrimidine deaminase/5-amino-6-(5-phosphoribosylamino)uracil reductase RibD [bacterium]
MITEFETQTLKHLLAISRRNAWKTRPNPAAVAAVVNDGVILGIGHHRGKGSPHAEVDILHRLGDRAKDSTIIVTLEPCTHWGDNPPCTSAIIASGIKRVIFPIIDPNPLVRKNSATELLQAHGIEVISGVLVEEAAEANIEFFTHISQQRPYVTAKIACSLDGKMGLDNGESFPISSATSLHKVHQLRNKMDAIMVGVNTIINDNPRLTIRGIRSPNRLIKIIVDSHARVPLNARCFENTDPADVFVITGNDCPIDAINALKSKSTIIELPFASLKGRFDAVVKALYPYSIYHVLLEGGPTLLSDAIDHQLVDRLIVIQSPILIGGTSKYSFYSGNSTQTLNSALQFQTIRRQSIGPDIWIEGMIHRPTSNLTKGI